MGSEQPLHGRTATSGPPRVDIFRCAGAFAYEHTDIPADMTISAWRANRHRVARRHRTWLRATTDRNR